MCNKKMKIPSWNECKRCGLSYFSTYSIDHQNDCDRDLLDNGYEYNFPFFQRKSQELYTFMNRSISNSNNEHPNVAENKLIFMNSMLADKCGFFFGDVLRLYIPRLNYTICKSLCLLPSTKHLSLVSLRKHYFDTILKAKTNEKVVINKINLNECINAKSIVLKVISVSEMEFIEKNCKSILIEIKKQYCNFVYSMKNQIFIVYFQKLLSFEIVQSNEFTCDQENVQNLFKTELETIWSIENIAFCSIEDCKYPIIGHESIVEEIKEIIMDFVNIKKKPYMSSILVHGKKYIGKSNICKYVKWYIEMIQEQNSNFVLKHFSEAVDKNFIKETLCDKMKQIIIIDNIDELISNKSESKKLIRNFLSEIRLERCPILIIATANEIDDINVHFYHKFELNPPNLLQRSKILRWYLEYYSLDNKLFTDNEINKIALDCDGFLPTDLDELIVVKNNKAEEKSLLIKMFKDLIKNL